MYAYIIYMVYILYMYMYTVYIYLKKNWDVQFVYS